MSPRSIVLPGTLDALGPLGDFIRAAAADSGFARDAAARLHLAVDEVATNAIIHGYAVHGLQGQLHLSAETDDGALRIHLEDTAPPYDPTRRAAPNDLGLPLEQRRIGGLGIYLARRSVDEFLYERRGDRNRVTFVLRRHAPSVPAAGPR